MARRASVDAGRVAASRVTLPDELAVAQSPVSPEQRTHIMRSTVGRPRALTDEQVSQILEWHKAVVERRKALKTVRQFAKELGVAPATVYNVIRRQGEFKAPSPDRREAELRGRRERILKQSSGVKRKRLPR